MHVIVIRHDLQEFQHVHPDFNAATGQFTLPDLVFPTVGPYRLFADFTPVTKAGVTVFEDIAVGESGKYQPQVVTEGATTALFQGYQVQLTTSPATFVATTPTTLSFAISKNNQPVTDLEKYLGALGHAVVLHAGDLEFIHTHAEDANVVKQDGTIDFAVTFPAPGNYKIFAQFQHQGEVVTTDFVVNVMQSPNSGSQPAAHGGH